MLNLIGVILSFIIVIFLIRKKFNFGLSLILGSLIIGIFSLKEIQVIDIPKSIIQASIYNFQTEQIYTYTVELALLMTLIYTLARLMQETGAITRLINSFRPIFSKGGTLGVIPALYGLMPVPGGALFSAPLIDEEGEKYKLNKNQKNYLNVWFRHIWFPIYPVSSAMILICSVEFSNIELLSLILANIPAFLTTIIIGLFFLKKFIKVNPEEIKNNHNNKDLVGFKFLLVPIIPLITYAFLWFFEVSQIRAFLIGVIISIFTVYFLTKISFEKFVELVKTSLTLKLALAIFGIMIFREMITVSGADKVISDLITLSHIPTISMVVLIPLILGFLTGYNLGAVALSYPIVQPFFPQPLDSIALLGFTSLIFISALVGYLISPIHLCNVLSSDYLKTDTTRMYRTYVPSTLVMLIVQIIFVILIINIL
jgi:uncharacterized protein